MPKAGAPPEKAQFYDGMFMVTQSTGSPTSRSPRRSTARSAGPRPSPKKPKNRKLWGEGKGEFRTRASTAPRPSAAPMARRGHVLRHAHARHAGQRRRPGQGQEEDDRRASAAREYSGQGEEVDAAAGTRGVRRWLGLAAPASASAATFPVNTTRRRHALQRGPRARCAARSPPRRRTAPPRTT